MTYDISGVIVLPRHQPSLAQLRRFQLPLLFTPVLPQIQHGRLQALAEASFCCQPDLVSFDVTHSFII